MGLTHPCQFLKKTKNPSTKKCIVTLIGVRMRLALFLWSIDHPAECCDLSVWSISRGSSSGIWILECHLGKCWLHSPCCCPKWTDDPSAISWEPETAKNCTEPNQDYKRVVTLCWFTCWPAKLPRFWQLSLCKIHRCFNSSLVIRICRCNCYNTSR